jgi:cytochrome c553/mono/diheme cytochrome c family protein
MSNARLVAAICVALASPLVAAEPAGTPEFFEKRIRPVLVEHCFRCHADAKKAPKGGLRLDSRDSLLKGGDNGPAIVAGQPDKSRLIEAVRYQNPDLQMPPKGKLSDREIADLVAWVKAGAVWPDGGTKANVETAAFDLAKRKREHWAWQPVAAHTPPAVRDATWPSGPIDRFLLAKLEERSLRPAAPADRRTWIRRVTFDLIGLPPTPAEIAAFLADKSADANRKVVERLLASPHFGERWGRHWLDVVRYAETRGHEFDAQIPNAYQYRDYVIRALNADVPYDRFVHEHVAGDLLPDPRRHPAVGFNESILGTGFWFLNEEVHSPVDIRLDQADRFDNRIDVLTKAFLGLTVSCARCHDHKFDAISTKDYYALFGIVESTAYRQVRFDTRDRHRQLATELDELNQRTAKELAAVLGRSAATAGPPSADRAAAGQPSLPPGTEVVIDYANCRPDQWMPDDASFGSRPRQVGELVVEDGKVRFADRAAAVYDRLWDALSVPPGTESEHGALGKRSRAGRSIRTPTFQVGPGKVYYLVRGAGTAYAAVDHHTLIAGPLHGLLVLDFPSAAGFRWLTHDLTAYSGHHVHIEFTPAKDSDFAVAMVVQGASAPSVTTSDTRAADALPQDANADIQKVIADYRAARERIAKQIRPMSRLAPAAWDGNGVDERVFIRGSPRGLGEVVPRRFLEALAGSGPLTTKPGSGRLELARQLTDPATNPFVARVVVNRVWHHLFGRGLVASVDNVGVLGETPSHLELLDFLADRFVRDGWSMKRLIADLVLSSAYQMSVVGDSTAAQADPQNVFLHRARIRRLEGEAIRDAMLVVSGDLDRTTFGRPVPVHLTPFLTGRGRPESSGPLDGDRRRSVYLAVRRNFLNPFLLAFDSPIPFSTVGRRQVSNVPAQALILLNDPFVHQQASRWGRAVHAGQVPPAEKVRRMYLNAFGRPPTADETAACLEFLAEQTSRYGKGKDSPEAWADLAHTLFNTKEFIYLN